MCIRYLKTLKFLVLIALPFASYGADGCTFAVRPFIFMENQIEIWKDVVGSEGYYQVSSFGRVKGLARLIDRPIKGKLPIRERIMTWALNSGGYPSLILSAQKETRTRAVHRLVAIAFIPNPENKPQINHINGIKTDNRVENLEWCTGKENVRHAIDTGLQVRGQGESGPRPKLNNEQVLEIRAQKGIKTQVELSLEYKVSQALICRIHLRKAWPHI